MLVMQWFLVPTKILAQQKKYLKFFLENLNYHFDCSPLLTLNLSKSEFLLFGEQIKVVMQDSREIRLRICKIYNKEN